MGGRKGSYGSKNKKVVGLSGVPIPARARRQQTTGTGGGGGGWDVYADGHILNQWGTSGSSSIATNMLDHWEASGIDISGITPSKMSSYLRDITDWSGSSFSSMKSAQLKNLQNSYRTKADNIEEFLAKAPKWRGGSNDTRYDSDKAGTIPEVYRGLRKNAKTRDELIRTIKHQMTTQGYYTEGAMASWSNNREVGESFAYSSHPVIFVVSGKGGKMPEHKYGTSIKPVSSFYTEEEFLVSSKAKYRVTKIETRKGKHGLNNIDTTYVYFDVD